MELTTAGDFCRPPGDNSTATPLSLVAALLHGLPQAYPRTVIKQQGASLVVARRLILRPEHDAARFLQRLGLFQDARQGFQHLLMRRGPGICGEL